MPALKIASNRTDSFAQVYKREEYHAVDAMRNSGADSGLKRVWGIEVALANSAYCMRRCSSSVRVDDQEAAYHSIDALAKGLYNKGFDDLCLLEFPVCDELYVGDEGVIKYVELNGDERNLLRKGIEALASGKSRLRLVYSGRKTEDSDAGRAI